MISSGFVNIIKPTGMSSSSVVAAVKKIINCKKVGHLGTLDPAASGVLPIAFGKATKFFDYFLSKDKIYVADVEFGVLTDTLDSFGNITKKDSVIVSQDDILKVIPKFLGEVYQVPPKFSAIKVNGKRACDIARIGENVELSPRKINIYSIELLGKFKNNAYRFRVHCSAGTYIRTLFNDLAASINTVATTPVIIREKSGFFSIDDAITLDELRQRARLISIEAAFKDFEVIEISNELICKKLVSGVKLHKQDLKIQSSSPFFIKNNENLIGMYHLDGDKMVCDVFLYENGI